MTVKAAKVEVADDTSTAKKGVTVTAPRMSVARYKLIGTAPLVTHNFSEETRKAMEDKQRAGSTAKSKKPREARDFEKQYEAAKYISEEGWVGFPAGGLRSAMIDSCRTTGVKMVLAKFAVFVIPDGFEKDSGKPLIRLNGKPKFYMTTMHNATGVTDLRARPQWRDWSADVKIKFDEDILSLTDVTNLLARAGLQCGIGEGRHNSRMSTGCGFGTFEIVNPT